MTDMSAEIERLIRRKQALEAEIEQLRAAREEIEAWSRAYPLSVFPKPDYERAKEVLEAAGMTLDSISADCMHLNGSPRATRRNTPHKGISNNPCPKNTTD